MFQFLQSHLKKIFIVLLFFIIPSFCLYFVGGGSKPASVVGEIFGQKVLEGEFLNAYKAVYLEAAMRYGDYFKQFEPFLKLEEQAWSRLMMLKKANENRISVSDEELREKIVKMFLLITRQKEFDQTAYKKFVVQNLNMSVIQYEKMVKASILIEKLREVILRKVTVSDSEVEEFYRLENDKLQFSYVKCTAKDQEEHVSVSTSKLEEYFKKDKVRFSIPEKIKLNYVFLEKALFNDKVKVTEDECKEYYEQNIDRYELKEEQDKESENEKAQKETRSVVASEIKFQEFESVEDEIQTILLKEKILNAAETYSDGIYREMIEKNDFTAVSKANMLEIKTTDFFDKRTSPSEIGDSNSAQIRDAFELAVKDFVGPYDYKQGWLILQVEEKKEEKIPEVFGEVKNEVESAFRKENASSLAKKEAEKAKQKIHGLISRKTFEEAAKELGYKSYVSGLISIKSQYVKGLGNVFSLVKKAFKLKEDEISDIISINQNSVFLFCQISKRSSPVMGKLKTQKEKYHKNTLEVKQREYFADWLDNLKDEADMKINLSVQQKRK